MTKKMWSPSLYLDFEKCEAKALAKVLGDWQEGTTDAMWAGKYFDAALCENGDFDEFVAENKAMFYTRTGGMRAHIVDADNAIKQVRRQPMAMKFLEGEHQRELVGEIAGVKFHGFADTIGDGFISDAKLVKDFKPTKWNGVSLPFERGYDVQLAIYQELHRQMTGEKVPCYLVMATKEDVPRVAVVSFDQDDLDKALQRVTDNIAHFDAVLRGTEEPVRCEDCDYCASTVTLDAIVDANELGVC